MCFRTYTYNDHYYVLHRYYYCYYILFEFTDNYYYSTLCYLNVSEILKNNLVNQQYWVTQMYLRNTLFITGIIIPKYN